MADKNTHNYDAGVAAGRKQFARELQMLIESMEANEYPTEEILETVNGIINEEVTKP
jgi:DNA-binding transcriptional regulator YhcF (GntR family)